MTISKETLLALSDEEKIHVIHELQELLEANNTDYPDFDEISQEEIHLAENEYAEYKRNPSLVIQGETAIQMIRSKRNDL